MIHTWKQAVSTGIFVLLFMLGAISCGKAEEKSEPAITAPHVAQPPAGFEAWLQSTFEPWCSFTFVRATAEGSRVAVKANVKNRRGNPSNRWAFGELLFEKRGSGWSCYIANNSVNTTSCQITMIQCEK